MTQRSYCIGFLLVVAGLVPLMASAQTDTLRLDSFLAQVARYHPLAQVGQGYEQLAAAELRIARGVFDPILSGSINEKTFKDQLYYNKRELGLKVPLGGLVDVSGGYENNTGEYINPENSTTGGSLLYAGVSVPLLRNLILDDRRAALQQARLLPQQGTALRQQALNKLILSAAKAYWLWWLAGETVAVQQQGVALAAFRLEGVRASVVNGDRAAIDTVEAQSEVYLRQVQLAEAQLLQQNARLALETFLWAPDLSPTALPDSLVPSPMYSELPLPYEQLLAYVTSQHPDLRTLSISLEQLRIQERQARQMLLPELNAEYKPYLQSQGSSLNLAQNYKWGLSLYVPLFLRKERGKLQATVAKRSQTEAALADLTRSRTNEFRGLHNTLLTFRNLVVLQDAQLRQSQQLLAGETAMFQNGESSLFLINQRERTVLSAQLKLYELQAKRNQAELERLFVAGWPLEEMFGGEQLAE